MQPVNGNNGSQRTNPEATGKTNTEEKENTTHGQRTVQIHPPKNLLTRAWEYLFPKEEARTSSQPMNYQRFRRLGVGATGKVELVYKSPENQNKKPEPAPTDTPFDLDALLARVELTLKEDEERPEKVPDIRRTAKQRPPVKDNVSRLLARKAYSIRADNPMEDPEYRLLKQLNHPNITKLVDSEITYQTSLMGDKLVNISLLTEAGITNFQTLAQKVAQKGQPLTARDTAHLMKGALAGVKHLHENWITHSDLKPANIVLMPDMNTKLIDLGSAKQFSNNVEQIESRNIGTPNYTAPEIRTGDEAQPVTFEQLQKADYWGTGCVLYELVTGAPLFDKPVTGDSKTFVEERIAAIQTEGWSKNDLLSLQECLSDLLNPAPDKRQIKSLETFIHDLESNNPPAAATPRTTNS